MKVGMLWYDNSNVTLAQKIEQAAKYYFGKYGARPQTVFVNPTMISGEPPVIDGLAIKTNRSVMVNHFWVGREAQ
jgi:hypothetical protein